MPVLTTHSQNQVPSTQILRHVKEMSIPRYVYHPYSCHNCFVWHSAQVSSAGGRGEGGENKEPNRKVRLRFDRQYGSGPGCCRAPWVAFNAHSELQVRPCKISLMQCLNSILLKLWRFKVLTQTSKHSSPASIQAPKPDPEDVFSATFFASRRASCSLEGPLYSPPVQAC